jgi:hypothetical protein
MKLVLILVWIHHQWVTIVLHHHVLLHHHLLLHHLLLIRCHLLPHLVHSHWIHSKWVLVRHHVLLLHHHHSLLLLHLIHLHHVLIWHAHLLLIEHRINSRLETARWLLLLADHAEAWLHAHLYFSTVALSC